MSDTLTNRPRLRLPSSARAGEVIEIRTLIDHPMLTGVLQDERDMLVRFVAEANGEPFFEADLDNGTSANPALTFHARVEETTEFRFVWYHEDGRSVAATERVRVG